MEIAENDSTLAAQLAIRDSALILTYIFNNFREVGNTQLSLDLFFVEKISLIYKFKKMEN